VCSYGDFVPKSALGCLVGSVCSVSGLLLLAMPIAIIATNFSSYYNNTSSYEQRIRRAVSKLNTVKMIG
jgi:ABC-type phosphate transport system permease subunit